MPLTLVLKIEAGKSEVLSQTRIQLQILTHKRKENKNQSCKSNGQSWDKVRA